jgi:uncharacterized protein (DUF2141 family)
MKKLILLSVLLSPVILIAQNNLEINIDNIKNNNGNIIIGLYAEDNHFPRNASDGKTVKASTNGISVLFQNIKPGIYAVSALHDENRNEDLDQNKMGMPKEGFGFSNNAKGVLGPPSFKKAHIELHEGMKDTVLSISINMRYMIKRK